MPDINDVNSGNSDDYMTDDFTLDNPTTQKPSFTAPDVNPNGVTLNFHLEVTLPDGTKDTDSVAVNVLWANDPPVITGPVYGQTTVTEDDTVSITASATDNDGDVLSYSWERTDSHADLKINNLSGRDSETLAFTAPLVGDKESVTLSFELTVSDGSESREKTVDVKVESGNNPPTVEIVGKDSIEVFSGEPVTLVGKGTDTDHEGAEGLSYQWTLKGGGMADLSDVKGNNTDTLSFTAPIIGAASEDYTFQLVVTYKGLDGNGRAAKSSEPATVTVTVINRRPIADAGADQEISEGNFIILDGSLSYDPDGDPLTYHWARIDRNDFFETDLYNDDRALATVEFDRSRINGDSITLTFQLTISDADGGSLPDTVRVTLKKSSSSNGGTCFISSVNE